MGQTAKTVRTKNGRTATEYRSIGTLFGSGDWRGVARGAMLCVSAVLLLIPAGESAQAQEPAVQSRLSPAKRQAVFKARMVDIENLFSSGATEEETQDYVQRLRQLANLAEASLLDKAARLELLRRKLTRVQASMGGAVEVPDEKTRAVYEAMTERLRKEEELILREISDIERR